MSESTPDTLLRVEKLNAAYQGESGHFRVVRDWSMSLTHGEVVGILGESGSGKTTSALAILGLLPPGAVVSGSVCFQGVELIGAREDTLQKIRGAQISLIQQEPLLSLNPVLRVVDQVAEVLRAHLSMPAAERKQRARATLQQVGLEGEALQNAYPHQLSGGQRQRVLIAQAVVCSPSLVIADEPTGALDAVSTLELLRLLHDLVRRLKASLILITHDPRLVAAIADRVLVIYAGNIVEAGPAPDVLRAPRHPYTQGLLRCLRDALPDAEAIDRHVPAIAGAAPDALLSVRRIEKTFTKRARLTGAPVAVRALQGVDLQVYPRQTLAIIGPSGAGKSTLARCIAGIEQPDAGEILLQGRQASFQTIHRSTQMIFQDPGASLNPRFTVEEALLEPLIVRRRASTNALALQRLSQVGLPQGALSRLTSQLSGGQKARLAIARALTALDAQDTPGVLILDESLSSLDLSIQAQTINLLIDLQQQCNLSYVLIAHDLTLVAHLADEVVVLCDGRIVESGAPPAVFQKPIHPQWRALVSATRALAAGRACFDA